MIVIVGNSDNVLHDPRGVEIDAYDRVVRCNRAPISGYEQAVGTKTTDRFINAHLSRGVEQNGECELDFADMTEQTIYSSHDFTGEEFNRLYPESCKRVFYPFNNWRNSLIKHDFDIDFSHNASIGFDAICYFLDERPAIYGFDLYDNHIFHHYWKMQKRKSTFHKWDYEKEIIRELIEMDLIDLI